jgi:hypothetical protein
MSALLILTKSKGTTMKTTRLIPVILAGLFAVPAFAQSAATEVQRDVRQQQRIEGGLKSGQLTTHEAAKLEHEEAHVDHVQAKALKDGSLSDAEKSRINGMQNRVSRDIAAEKHDAQTGHPDSASSKRMQADVQRNINQQQRTENGIKNGSLTNQEVAGVERGQARIARKEARAGIDGHVGRGEQKRVQRADNRQSRRIHHEKHDG